MKALKKYIVFLPKIKNFNLIDKDKIDVIFNAFMERWRGWEAQSYFGI